MQSDKDAGRFLIEIPRIDLFFKGVGCSSSLTSLQAIMGLAVIIVIITNEKK